MVYDIPQSCSWFPFSDQPVLSRPVYSPKLCDPFIVMPEQSGDRRWHLFIHSWLGIHHYISTSGIAWQYKGLVVFRGHSPFIYREDGVFYLLYEKHDLSSSVIEIRKSSDLEKWSKPVTLFNAEDVPCAGDYLKHKRLSRPQLFKINSTYRLYFGASHIVLPQTKQKVSRYFTFAQSDSLDGSFELYKSDRPLLESYADDKWTNMGCGSVRIIYCNDTYYAFQCGVYWDVNECKTHSAMLLLESCDGVKFTRAKEDPILVPAKEGWTEGYIMSCDVHYKYDEKCWYCYFCANNGKRFLSEESIGLMIGTMPPGQRKTTESR